MDLSTTIINIVGHCGNEGPDDSSIAALNIVTIKSHSILLQEQ